MLIVRYEYSIDPVLKMLREAPEVLFGRSYAGYLLFLFGESDENFATWFVNRISSLDSLTGEFIAGAVFAKRIRIKSKEGEARGRPGEQRINVPDRAIVRVEDIKTSPLPETDWKSDDREIVATTYGSDELATAMGILNDMPCMVVINARTPEYVELLRLDPLTTDRIIPLFRRVIANLTSSPDFTAFWRGIRTLEGRSQSVSRAERNIVSAREEVLKRERLSLPRLESISIDRQQLRTAVLEAKTKTVRLLTRRFSEVAGVLAEGFLRNFKDEQPFLAASAKTIDSLRYYLVQEWPIPPDSLEHLGTIRDSHVRDLVHGLNSESTAVTRENVERWCSMLVEGQRTVAERLLSDVEPSVLNAQITALAVRSREASIAESKDEYAKAVDELKRLNWQYSDISAQVRSSNPPSVSDMFRRVAREERVGTLTRNVGKALVTYGAKLLSPDTLLKLVQPSG